MNNEHYLKILPEYFEAVRLEAKRFEIRKNDRNYQVGDALILKEYKDDEFTGNLIKAVVTYITNYAQKDDYIVMSIILDD